MCEKWLDLDDEILELRSSKKYIYLNLGIVTVNPLMVVSLSRELDQDKLDRIRDKIINNGWIDVSPGELRLLLMPNGSYVVDGGGNHRVYICNELGIENIKAKVGTYMNKDFLSHDELEKHESYEIELTALHKKISREKNEEVKSEYEDQRYEFIKNHDAWLQKIYNKMMNEKNTSNLNGD